VKFGYRYKYLASIMSRSIVTAFNAPCNIQLFDWT
jgi:hypothetical protein